MADQLKKLSITVDALYHRIQKQDIAIDNLKQYSRSNCIVLHGCQDVPAKGFEDYVCKK